MLVGRKYRLAFTPGQVEMAEEFGNICRAPGSRHSGRHQ